MNTQLTKFKEQAVAASLIVYVDMFSASNATKNSIGQQTVIWLNNGKPRTQVSLRMLIGFSQTQNHAPTNSARDLLRKTRAATICIVRCATCNSAGCVLEIGLTTTVTLVAITNAISLLMKQRMVDVRTLNMICKGTCFTLRGTTTTINLKNWPNT